MKMIFSTALVSATDEEENSENYAVNKLMNE